VVVTVEQRMRKVHPRFKNGTRGRLGASRGGHLGIWPSRDFTVFTLLTLHLEPCEAGMLKPVDCVFHGDRHTTLFDPRLEFLTCCTGNGTVCALWKNDRIVAVQIYCVEDRHGHHRHRYFVANVKEMPDLPGIIGGDTVTNNHGNLGLSDRTERVASEADATVVRSGIKRMNIQ